MARKIKVEIPVIVDCWAPGDGTVQYIEMEQAPESSFHLFRIIYVGDHDVSDVEPYFLTRP